MDVTKVYLLILLVNFSHFLFADTLDQKSEGFGTKVYPIYCYDNNKEDFEKLNQLYTSLISSKSKLTQSLVTNKKESIKKFIKELTPKLNEIASLIEPLKIFYQRFQGLEVSKTQRDQELLIENYNQLSMELMKIYTYHTKFIETLKVIHKGKKQEQSLLERLKNVFNIYQYDYVKVLDLVKHTCLQTNSQNEPLSLEGSFDFIINFLKPFQSNQKVYYF